MVIQAGPLTTVWDVYRNGYLAKSSNPPIWIILIGALGLVIGLGTYGEDSTPPPPHFLSC